MKELFKSFGKFFLCALPIGLIFCFLNSALILWKETSPQYGIGFWSWMFVFAATIAFVFATLGFTSKLISEKIFKTKNVDVIVQNTLISIFLALFIATIFYPYKGLILDGGTKNPIVVPRIVGLILLHLSVAAVFVWTSFKQKEIFRNLCVIAMAATLGLSGIQMFKFVALNLQAKDVKKTEISFSKNENIIIILADMLQGSLMEMALEEFPELRKDFKDFDVFTRATSVFSFTNYSVPSMLSGKVYNLDKEKATFVKNLNATMSDSFLTDAQKKNWEPSILTFLRTKKEINPLNLIYKEPNFQTTAPIISASIGRILSVLLTFDGKLYDTMFYQKKFGYSFITNYNKWKLGDEKNKVSFFHLLTPHAPVFNYSFENGKVVYKLLNQSTISKKEILSEIDTFMTAVGDSFEKLKELGIYDSSTIVVIGDHGNGYCAKPNLIENIDKKHQETWSTNGFWNRPACMHNPVVMVKLPNQKYSEPKLSEQPISIINLRKFVNAVIDKEKDPLKKFTEFYSEKGNPVALVDPNIKSDFFTRPESHKVFYIKGNAHKMSEVMFHPSALESCYTRVPMGKELTMRKISIRGGLKGEKDAAWLHGGRGIILFEIDPTKLEKDLNIKINASSVMINEKHPAQRIFVDFYDKRLASFNLKSSPARIEFKIPANLIKAKDGKVMLNLYAPDAVTPKSIGAWEYDQSKLSIFVTGIMVEEEIPFASYFTQKPLIPPVPFDKQLTMDKFATTGSFMLEGKTGWIHGDDGAIVFKVNENKVQNAVRVKIDCSALITPSHPKQRVFVDFYDKPLTNFELTQQNGILEFDIPKSMIQEKEGTVLINFRTPDAVTPKSAGAWDYETTRIGLYLKSVLLENK